MFTKALLPDTVRAIELVSKIDSIKSAYLAGGSALALHLGHRISEDLDFFTDKIFDENKLSLELSQIPEYEEAGKSWRTVWGKIANTKFSIFYYKYAVIKNPIKYDGIRILDLADIAAMKINALEDRGTKRDFVDVFFLAKKYSLEEMLNFYNLKYQCLQDHLYSIIRSLNYFADADSSDERPLKMLIDVSWEEVKEYFKKEVVRLAKSKLKI